MLAMLATLALTLTPGTHAAFNGISGSGKTRLAQQAAAQHSRVGTFDPYAKISWDARDRGERVSPWGDELVPYSELVRAPELLDRPRFNLVVDPQTSDPATLGKRFSVFAQICWHTRGMLVVAEEEGLYGRHAVPALLQLTTGGRHQLLASLHVAQNIGRVPIDVRRNLNAIASGPQSEPADIAAIRARCGSGVAARVARLRLGDPFVFWRLGEGALESAS